MAEYKITVNFNDASQTKKGYQSSFSAPLEGYAGTSSGIATPIENGDGGFNAFAKGVKAFAKAVAGASLVKSAFDGQIALVERYTGSQQAQAQANAGMKIASQVGGVIGAFATGGILGGLLAIGAVGLGYAKEVGENIYGRKWDNIGIQLTTERAGPSLNRSRTGV